MTRRLLMWGALLSAAALLAFWLQGVIQDLCIVPAIELLQVSGLLLRSIPHWVFWSLLLVGAAFIALGSLTTGAAGRAARGWVSHLPYLRPRHAAEERQDTKAGPIGELAWYIHNTRRGLYFKWLVAHRLGELAQTIVVSGEGDLTGLGKPVRSRGKLVLAESAAVQAYLEAGLGRPPVSQPRLQFLSHWRRRQRHAAQAAPLDLKPSEVIEYLAARAMRHRAAEDMRHKQSQVETKT